jgi:hypothetical protein
MNWIWFFLAMPLLSFLCAACIIVRSKRFGPPDCVTTQPKGTIQAMPKRKPFWKREREIRWITMQELDELVHRSDDVVFIDLRSPNGGHALPPSAKHALPVAPDHLIDALPWFSAETSICALRCVRFVHFNGLDNSQHFRLGPRLHID